MEKIKFYTKSTISSTPELKMVIDVSGNVGIGESNPTKTLEVVGDISFNGNIYQNGEQFQGGTIINSTTDISTNSLSAQTIISANNLTSDILKVGTPSNILFSIETKITASDAAASDFFGGVVAISDNYAIVGSKGDDDNGEYSGSAYIFDVSSGNQLHKLTANDGGQYQYFGISVAITNNYALVGASRSNSSKGSVYIFDVSSGNQLRKLTASDGAGGDLFGSSVDIDGIYAIIGAYGNDDDGSSSGSAYIFDISSGTQLHKLTANDGAAGDKFGISVSISSNYVIIGASDDDDDGSSSGSAYIFDVSNGIQLHKLTSSDAASTDFFGYSVAIDGNYAIVGARYDDDNGENSGSAYIFDVQTGTQLRKITPNDGGTNDYFGWSVDIDGNYTIIGSKMDDDKGGNSGSVYIFDVQTGTQLYKLTASDGVGYEEFGTSVAINNNYAIVGAYKDSDNGEYSGSAYIYPPQIFTGNLLDVSDNVYIQSDVGVYVSSPQYTLHVDGTVAGSSAFVNTSDNRVKHNEQPVTNALSTISKLTPKNYFKTKNKLYDSSHNFILDVSGNPLDNNQPLILNKDYTIETGIIAQEIQTIPELKFAVHETIPLGVDYNSIHCTHIDATKELYELVQTQQQKINNLKQEKHILIQRLQIIKQHLGI